MPKPVLREARFDDYDQIAALELANGLNPRSRDAWSRFWRDNPAYQTMPHWPIGWVLDDDGRIVGSIGNIPFLYYLGGRRYVVATARGWAVEPAYRVFSVQLLLQYMRQPGIDLCLNTTLNARAAEVSKRLGWARVPVGQWDRAAFWITSYPGFVQQYLRTRLPAPLSRLIGRLCDTPVAFWHGVSVSGCSQPAVRRDLKWCTEFDQRFDVFWNRLKEERPHMLLAARTREVLEWHFFHALREKRAWIVAATEGPEIIGYMVAEEKETQYGSLRRVRLVDMVALDASCDAYEAMMALILERCRREGIHALDNTGCWIERDGFLKAKAPHHRMFEAPCYLYHAPNPELRDVLRNAVPWHPTLYDGDATL